MNLGIEGPIRNRARWSSGKLRRVENRAAAELRESALERLHEVAVAAGGVLDLQALGKLVVDSARDLLRVDSAGLYWHDEASGGLRRIAENDPTHTSVDVVPPHGTSVARFAFEQDRVIVAEDYPAWSGAYEHAASRGVKSALAVPLRLDQRAVGTLVVRSYLRREFQPEQIHLLELLAAQVTPVLEGARLHAQSERRRLEAESLADLARQGAATADVDALANLICDRTCQLLASDFAGLLVQSESRTPAWMGVRGSCIDGWHNVGWSTELSPAVLALDQPSVFSLRAETEAADIPGALRMLMAREAIGTLLTVPLRPADSPLGSLLVGWRDDTDLGSEARNLAEAIASYAAVILENSQARAVLAERADRLAASQEKLRTLYESVACGVLVWNENQTIVHANAAAQEIFGRSQSDLLGRKPVELWTAVTEDGRAVSAAAVPNVAQTKQAVRKITLRTQLPSGESRWLQGDVVPIHEPGGAVNEVVASFVDITARKNAEQELHWQAWHDSLTGLPNRAFVNERLQRAITLARSNQEPMTLMFIDLDRFKDVNDTLGHSYGDVLLRQTGPRLEKGLRPEDTLGRIGGDEFAVIMPGLSPEDGPRMAQRFLAALTQPMIVNDQPLDVSASIGIASFPMHGHDAQDLMRAADVAMYFAKRSGRRYAVFEPEMDPNLSASAGLAGELREALQTDQIQVFYQPKVQCLPDTRARAEALVRWSHPRRGLLSPDLFVPLAEQTGLIKPLTQYVLQSAARQCRNWHRAGRDVSIAVNVSIHNLQDPEFPKWLHDFMTGWEIFPHWLRLEITESTIMVDAPESAISRLTSMGIPLSIDDFGTGYSSLVRVKQLPIDEIKIDKSFVLDLTSNPSDQVIVRSIIELAHNLGKQVVAEGVETEAAWDWLVEAGCDAAQGYYLGRPMPAADLEAWLGGSHRTVRRRAGAKR